MLNQIGEMVLANNDHEGLPTGNVGVKLGAADMQIERETLEQILPI